MTDASGPDPHKIEDRTSAVARGRRAAAIAGHTGDDLAARRLLADGSPAVRATALGALVRMGASTEGDVSTALSDPSPHVRRRACRAGIDHPGLDLLPMLDDADPMVVEAAAWAIGERGEAGAPAVEAVSAIATGHDEPLCREAAVAALGAIGHPTGLAAILAATSDKPAVRRRAVIALAPFDGPEVDAAIARALDDRDWQVRQAAEDLGERG